MSRNFNTFASIIAFVLANMAILAAAFISGGDSLFTAAAALATVFPFVVPAPFKEGDWSIYDQRDCWSLYHEKWEKENVDKTLKNVLLSQGMSKEEAVNICLLYKKEKMLEEWSEVSTYFAGYTETDISVEKRYECCPQLLFDLEELEFYGGESPFFFPYVKYGTMKMDKEKFRVYEGRLCRQDQDEDNLRTLCVGTGEREYTLFSVDPKLERQIKCLKKANISRDEWRQWIYLQIEWGRIYVVTKEF